MVASPGYTKTQAKAVLKAYLKRLSLDADIRVAEIYKKIAAIIDAITIAPL